MDDVRSAFDDTVDRVPVPPGDLAAVVRRGRARRLRRIATMLASVSVVVVAGWGAAAILGGQDVRTVPGTVDPTPPAPGRLVPVVTKGRSPSPELAPADEIADARAITVGFHAFLEGTGRRFEFDYEGFGGSDGTWWIRFAQSPPPLRQETRLQEVQERAEAEARDLRGHRAELREAVRRLRNALQSAAGQEARDVRRRLDRSRRERRRLDEVVARVERNVARIQAQRRRLLGVPRPYRTEITVVERDGMLVVDDVYTDSPEAAALRSSIGYAEPVADVDAWGADYYDATFRPRTGSADGVVVEAFGFWTGPLHSRYEERCRPRVFDRAGEVVWTGPLGVYETAPRRDEIRDRLRIELGLGYDGDSGDLSLRMLCEWRPRQ
ncbi:MAG TPA: hypothetical protein VEU29_05715 [Actinomycetota bacterium]|nr:hypothetical protein [Actinomycetota bacterium]